MDILEKLVTIAGIIFVGWYAYNLFFKKDDTSIQPPSLQSEYRVTTNDYQKQQEVSKKIQRRMFANRRRLSSKIRSQCHLYLYDRPFVEQLAI